MYEWNEESKRWDAAHHPFTSPHEDDIKSGALYNDKGSVRALAYDIVLNGTELGSGSIRIHRQDVQAEIFRTLGMTDEEAKERFGFFLQALEYGTPPHGGIAPRTRPHRDDPRRRAVAARSDCLSQDREGHRLDGRRSHSGQRCAVARAQPAHRAPQLAGFPISGPSESAYECRFHEENGHGTRSFWLHL